MTVFFSLFSFVSCIQTVKLKVRSFSEREKSASVVTSSHTGQTNSLPSLKSFVTRISNLSKPHKVRLGLMSYPCLRNIYYALSYIFCKYFVLNPLLIQFVCCPLYHTPVYAILIIVYLFRIYFVLYPLVILFFFFFFFLCCCQEKKLPGTLE